MELFVCILIFAFVFANGAEKRKEEKIKEAEKRTGIPREDLWDLPGNEKKNSKVNERAIWEPVFFEHFVDRD